MLLCLDTSTSNAGIALAEPGTLLAELNWRVDQRHSAELLARLRGLLEGAGARPSDLTAVAVALGPGSFNGVRVALATAKALAISRALRLVGIPTLDVIAWGEHLAVGPVVWAALEAGRQQLYTARYATPAEDPARWAPEEGYAILTPAQLSARTGAGALICGELRDETRATLTATPGGGARLCGPLATRRAAWLAELALARLSLGRYDDAASIEPLYLRRPAVTNGRHAPWAVADERQSQPLEGLSG